MIGLYLHAAHDPGESAGPFVAGYAPKGVLHTTEGGTYAGALATYRATRSWPHLTASYERGRFECWQHLPVTAAARALRNPAGGVQTNFGGAVQVELVGTCDPRQRGRLLYVEDFPAGYLAGIAGLMRWIQDAAGIQPRTVSRWKAYPESYGPDNGLRLSPADWRAFNGWCGHQHIPENTHGDPGLLPIRALLDAQEDPDMPAQDYFDEQFRHLEAVIKGQTGELARIARTQHGAVIERLRALPVPADPDALTAAILTALDLTDDPEACEEIYAAVTTDPPSPTPA